MGGLNSLDGLWVDWIFGGCLADGGQAVTLIYKLTHVRVCVCILAKGCPPVRPVYPCPSIFRLILTSSNGRSYTIHPFIYYPSADTCLAYALALIAGLLQYHSQPIQRHRALNTALYDQFIANLGGSHKLTK